MSKKILLAGLAGLLLVATVFGAALAQGTNPPAPDDQPQFDQRFPFPWGGRGMMGGMFGHMFGNENDDDMPGFSGTFGMPMMGVMGHGGMFDANGDGWKVYDAVAAALKLTPTQLFEQLHSGKTLSEIADAQGVKLADVQAAAQTAARDAMKARIEQAVKDGRLTQAQADQMLKALEQGNVGPGIMGRRGIFRNWRGMPFFHRQQQAPEDSF